MPPRAVVTISSNVRRVWRTPPRAVANGHLVAPISCHIVVTVRAATTDCVVVAVVIVVFVAAVVVDTAVVAGLVVVVVAVVVVAVVVVVALVVVIVFVCDVGMVGVAAVVGIVCVRSPFQEQSSVAAASWNAPPCREHMWKGGLWSAMQRHLWSLGGPRMVDRSLGGPTGMVDRSLGGPTGMVDAALGRKVRQRQSRARHPQMMMTSPRTNHHLRRR